MAEVEEGQFGSLAERIAALNQQKNFSSNGDLAIRPVRPARRAPPSLGGPSCDNEQPQLPPRPVTKTKIAVLPQRTESSLESAAAKHRRAPPPLPDRSHSTQPSPALPPRNPSTQSLSARRGSDASDQSHVSSVSTLSLNRLQSNNSTTPTDTHRRLPPTLDQARLPPLPPTRREQERNLRGAQPEQAGERPKAPPRQIKSAPAIPKTRSSALPPRLPTRPLDPSPAIGQEKVEEQTTPALPPRPAQLPTSQARPKSAIPSLPARCAERDGRAPDVPPPIPTRSRPTASQMEAVSARASPATTLSCLVCRDFSQPDAVAAQYPSRSLPRQDPVGYLASALCAPFPSPTDKARAIFTWCHHNIAYDVEGFFGNFHQHLSVTDTISQGKAVCQGYAEVYQAIAQRAGLHCSVISGHGKGYGYEPLRAGQACPPKKPDGHAWNAVRIDDGEWKLIDACWGAGNLMDGKYNKEFDASKFYISNERFGSKHFPQDDRHFFLPHGRNPSWEEYLLGPTNGLEQAQWMGLATQEGLCEYSFAPATKHISVRGDAPVRFQVCYVCEHWIPERHGRGRSRLLMMQVHGAAGRKDALVLLETDGFWWWTDIPARELGAPGQAISLFALKELNGKDARNVSRDEYLRVTTSGGYSMSWDVYIQWELV